MKNSTARIEVRLILLDEREFVLVPITSRTMPVDHLAAKGKRFETLQALADTIRTYPEGSIVHFADLYEFDDPKGRLSRLPDTEIESLQDMIRDTSVEFRNGLE